jgi:hypothetical protein
MRSHTVALNVMSSTEMFACWWLLVTETCSNNTLLNILLCFDWKIFQLTFKLSGTWSRFVWRVFPDVSELFSAVIFRIKQSNYLVYFRGGLCKVKLCFFYCSSLKSKELRSFETSDCQTTQCYILEFLTINLQPGDLNIVFALLKMLP